MRGFLNGMRYFLGSDGLLFHRCRNDGGNFIHFLHDIRNFPHRFSRLMNGITRGVDVLGNIHRGFGGGGLFLIP